MGDNSKQTPAVPNDRVPRLIVLLNEVPLVFDQVWPKENLAEKIGDILYLISFRLSSGLKELWDVGEDLCCWDTKKWDKNNPDEQWARAVSELLVGTAYNGPAPSTGFAVSSKEFWDRFHDDDDPIVPITFACAHLSTVGVLSRGIRNDKLAKTKETGVGYNMLGTEAFDPKMGGNWYNNNKKEEGTNIKIPNGLTPASLYGWMTDNGKSHPSHVVFMLRIDEASKRAQVLDTGGVNIANRNAGVIAMNGGNFDDPLQDTIPGPKGSNKDNYQGYGVPIPSQPDVQHLRKIRPFGLARLVLSSPVNGRDENPKEIHFVSRLLRMYSDNPDENFPTSLMYWSLRDHPYEEDLQAWWILYSPVGKLAKSMFEQNARNQKVKDLYQNVGGIGKSDLKKLIIISSIGGGKVKCRQRSTYKLTDGKPDESIDGYIKNSIIETKADPSNTNPLTSFNPTNAKIPLLLNDGYESLGTEKIDAALLNFNHNEFPINNAGIKGTSPAIEIFNLNSQTQKPVASIAIILDDLDAQDFEAEGSEDNQYNHWVIWNIPIPSNNKIPENILKLKTVDRPIKAVQGVNTGKTIGYIGPNPPEGTTHRYIFRIFGLDQMLTLSPGSNKSALIKAMDTHILQTGEYVATYTSRQKTK